MKLNNSYIYNYNIIPTPYQDGKAAAKRKGAKMTEYIFIDLDETLLDFKRAEKEAVAKALEHFGIEDKESTLALYSKINLSQWKLLEQQKITLPEVKSRRFELLFKELGCDASPESAAEYYEECLGDGAYALSGAEEALKSLLCKGHRLFLASNGTRKVQERRLEKTGLGKYFEKVFVSEEIGFFKPDSRYFEACFSQISGFDRLKAVMVGDSLSSDITGGINAGIETVWLNRFGEKNESEIQPDYEISDISELPGLIENI